MSSRLTLRRVKFSNPRTDWWPNQDHFDPQGTIDSIFAPSRTACRNYMITNTHLLVRYPLPKIYIEMFSDLTFGSVSFVKSNPSISRPFRANKKKQKEEPRPPGIYCCSSPTKSGPPTRAFMGWKYRIPVEKHEPQKIPWLFWGPVEWNVISLYFSLLAKFMGVIGICKLPTKQTLNCSSLFIETLRVPPKKFLDENSWTVDVPWATFDRSKGGLVLLEKQHL